MRSTLFLFAAVVLAAFVARATEPPTAQGANSATTTTTLITIGTPPADTTGAALTPEATGAELDSTPAASSAATPESAPANSTGSDPITLKMATVPPPAEFHPPAGYRVVHRGLDTVYCKSYTPIGSRMPETHCMSQAQVEQKMKQEETERRLMQEKTHTGGTSGT